MSIKILTDVHTHTNACDHAFSTLGEMVNEAASFGLELIAITNHGTAMSDSPHPWHFGSLVSNVPTEINGVKVIKGMETNITSHAGDIDLPEHLNKRLDIIIASMHGPCIESADKDTITAAWLKVIENPAVDILGHMGNPTYPIDVDVVVKAAKEWDKMIEINNHSFEARAGSGENCRQIALACKKYGVKITVNSDAHYCGQLGRYPHAIKMLEEIDFPQELIMNKDAKTIIKELSKKRPWVMERYGE